MRRPFHVSLLSLSLDLWALSFSLDRCFPNLAPFHPKDPYYLPQWSLQTTQEPTGDRAGQHTRTFFEKASRETRCRNCKCVVRSYSPLNVPPALTITCRPTGWHGESGDAKTGGHIMVDFCTRDGVHITTHHVYRVEESYEGTCIKIRPIFMLIYLSIVKDLGDGLAKKMPWHDCPRLARVFKIQSRSFYTWFTRFVS
jgi:hypothetical protein